MDNVNSNLEIFDMYLTQFSDYPAISRSFTKLRKSILRLVKGMKGRRNEYNTQEVKRLGRKLKRITKMFINSPGAFGNGRYEAMKMFGEAEMLGDVLLSI